MERTLPKSSKCTKNTRKTTTNKWENSNHDEIPPPTYNVICTIINKMKTKKKAAGTDNITGELIKYGGRTLKQKIHKLICNIWNSEILPVQWNEGIICPIYKKRRQAEL